MAQGMVRDMICEPAVFSDAGPVFSAGPQRIASAKRLARALLFVISSMVGGAAVLLPEPALAQCAQASPCVTAPTNLGTLGGSQSDAYGVNADGSVVVGRSLITGDTAQHAFRWTSGGMVDLG